MNKAKYQYFCTKCGATRDSLLDHPAESGGYSWNCPRCNGPVDSSEVVMNEAPKKIWVRELPRKEDGVLIGLSYHTEPEGLEKGTEHPYIRADIVDELVEALEKGMEFNEAYWKLINFSPSDTGLIKELTDKARAVLKKLEGE